MFDSASQEESRKTGLIVAGAILVILAGLVVFYFMYLRQEPEASTGALAAAVAQLAALPAYLNPAG